MDIINQQPVTPPFGDIRLKIEALDKKTKEVSDNIKIIVKERILTKIKLKNDKLTLFADKDIEDLIQDVVDRTIDEIVEEDKKYMNSLIKGLEDSIKPK